MEVWSEIAGTKVSAIPLSSYPSFVSDLLIFETPGNMADNYGARIRGYICAPSTGYYTFWISSDDQSELWLGADEDPVKKTKVANVYGWTQPRQWDKYTTQRSAPIHLVSGMRYYVEALLKEASGADHLSVGWQLPDGKLERPIAGASLIPFAQSAASRVAVMSQSEVLMNVTPPEGELTEISLYPNPLNGTETEIIIEGLASSPRNIVGFVEIRRPTGELLQQDKINIKQENRKVSFLLQNSIARGVYFVHIKINNQTTTRRLLVN